MVHYKLTYFNARGLAEISRQLFHMAGVEFEDERINEEKFSQLKPTFPSGQVPILCIDGAQFSQSTAIARYLARKFGFVGQTAEEELQADEVVDTFKDFIESFRKFVIAVLSGESEEILKNIREEVIKPAVKTYTAYLKAILEKSSSGYLVGNELTWADLVIADNLTTLINAELLDIENDKLLKEFREKIIETPKLKEWLAKRPETRF
ncbi:Glutathione S-transferase 3 [Caenorhabditis elegans]|uniref:Glutathione S-transferase 3 n=1 Tax=Caenorhabditis elegans TaxID=6239 RepID=GST3_CAEEL|nr:Glutathione S-transferase 3 [Caenorhabditis elegans]O16116.1 RecName: Full=Glutathione S-transferase 3; AltName: Full=CeGST3; AltName: Full=GST class-sigma [Caenorhabditis elegans]AAB65419.1 glutathione S-transferase [Caenorhabditis elegans]CAA93088.2 Glutathione S-transferase 3 [Caenorhabditis elegans]|eukprot:NP_501846.1 Glutathione S-transferase 3 [Caenorhabditis elegans]